MALLKMTAFQPQQFGKMLLIIGAIIFASGLMIILLSKTGLFKLPGDLHFEGKNWKVYFPIVSCLIISVIVTVVMWIIHYFRK